MPDPGRHDDTGKDTGPEEGGGGSAETRTDLAEDRTLLANERTFAGWMRTGLATIGIGVGFHALFLHMEPAWVPKAIATLFLLVGLAVVAAAERRACRVRERLSTHVVESARPMNLKVITASMVAGTLALIAAIWLAPMD